MSSRNKAKRSQQREWSSRWLYLAATVPLIVFVLVYVFYIYTGFADTDPTGELSRRNFEAAENLSSKRPPSLSKDINISLTRVKEIEWSSDDGFLSGVVKKGKPVLIRNAPVKSWDIMRWDLLNIAKSGFILNASRHKKDDSVFVLSGERDKGGMLGTGASNVAYVDVYLKDFLDGLFDKDSYLYWTGSSSVWEKAGARVSGDSSNGWEILKVVEPTINISLQDANIWNPMIWLSHPAVVAQTHYDTQHNFFLQVLGKKRFFIFPLDSELYPYPNIHVSYRQSQMHLENTTSVLSHQNILEKFPRARELQAAEVIVSPGDLLYIPPFWSHRVESLSFSMSLSVLSPSAVEAALSEAYWSRIPFGLFEKNIEFRGGAVKLFVAKLISLAEVFEGKSYTDFAADLYHSRFRPLFPEIDVESRYSRENFKCPSTNNDELVDLLKKSIGKFEEAAIVISELINELDVHNKVKETFFRDYAEQLIRWAVGPADAVLFLKYCLMQ
jgi:hypothetical protein